MSNDRPEIRQWLADRGHSPKAINKILVQLDKFDDQINRDSLFEDLASGAFDIGPIIKAALGDNPVE